jgi:uncharacterized protein with NRDE domain
VCLAAFALGMSERFPLVLAANRDEFHDRPAAGMAWWSPTSEGTEILAGRDLQAGGTWMGLSAAGRLALLTNIRAPGRQQANAPSRGNIVTRWLTTCQRTDRYWMQTALAGHNGFNLIAADFSRGDCYWMSSAHASPRRLDHGVFGLSNGSLDEPWPKVVAIKQQLVHALQHADTVPGSTSDELASNLLAALGDTQVASDDQLPVTGIAVELERQLSACFIRTPDGRYGTRCSTVLVTEQRDATLVTTIYERSHATHGNPSQLRRVTLRNWPPSPAGEALLLPLGEQRPMLVNRPSPPRRSAAAQYPVILSDFVAMVPRG